MKEKDEKITPESAKIKPQPAAASPKKEAVKGEHEDDWLLINRVVQGKDVISTWAMKVPQKGAIHRVIVSCDDNVVSVSDHFMVNVFVKEIVLATTGKRRNTYSASM